MAPLAATLVALQLLTTALCASLLHRRHQHGANTLPGSLRGLAPALPASSLLPLVPLLAFNAPALFWGLWGTGYVTAALVYAAADTARDLPPDQSTSAQGAR